MPCICSNKSFVRFNRVNEDFCFMKRIHCFLLLALFYSSSVFSQYYYNDIVAQQQSAKQYASLTGAHIKHVSAASFEGNRPVDGFTVEQRISPDGKNITINTSDPSSGTSVTINTYRDGKLVQTIDSSTNVLSKTLYTYDGAGNITTITSASDDAFMNSHSTEVHQWSYDNNLPKQMLRIKDKTDTTFVTFTYDNNNLAQETWTRKKQKVQTYYYYYDARNQLTDIVRFNERVRKMLPDFLYEYDETGRISQMMQVPAGSADYIVWKYTYNANGLKQTEMAYNKQQQPVGRIEYTYE